MRHEEIELQAPGQEPLRIFPRGLPFHFGPLVDGLDKAGVNHRLIVEQARGDCLRNRDHYLIAKRWPPASDGPGNLDPITERPQSLAHVLSNGHRLRQRNAFGVGHGSSDARVSMVGIILWLASK